MGRWKPRAPLALALEERGVSQAELAERIGLSRKMVSLYCRGLAPVQERHVEAVAAASGLTADEVREAGRAAARRRLVQQLMWERRLSWRELGALCEVSHHTLRQRVAAGSQPDDECTRRLEAVFGLPIDQLMAPVDSDG